MTRRLVLCACLVGALAAGCIKLDGFFFQADGADSVDGDYHGLPLFQGEGAPLWVDESSVEREVYLAVPAGTPLEPDALEGDYIHGAFLPAPSDCPPDECPLIDTGVTFLYQHGNSGNLFRYWYRAVALHSLGANVFVYTFRGYGLSSGEASRGAWLEDAETAMRYILTRPDVDPDQLVAYGYSTGAIPVSHLVGRSEFKDRFLGAVLESGLDSIESILDLSTRTEFPDGFFFDDTQFDGPTFISDSQLPVLHIHGGEDTRVPLVQTERYYEVLRGRPDYTHRIGKSNHPDEDWLRAAGHRNIPNGSFLAEKHIADYWDHDTNGGHCCIHPLAYAQSRHEEFLDEVGKTDGAASLAAAERYAALIASWVRSLIDG